MPRGFGSHSTQARIHGTLNELNGGVQFFFIINIQHRTYVKGGELWLEHGSGVCPTVLTRVTAPSGYGHLMLRARPVFRKRALKPDDACFITVGLYTAAFDCETRFSWLPDDIIKLLGEYLLAATYPAIRYRFDKFPVERSVLAYSNSIVGTTACYSVADITKRYGALRQLRSSVFASSLIYHGDFEDILNPIQISDPSLDNPNPMYRAHVIECYTLGSGERAMMIMFDVRCASQTATRLNAILRATADSVHDFARRCTIDYLRPEQIQSKGQLYLRMPVFVIRIRQCHLHHWATKKCVKHSQFLEKVWSEQCQLVHRVANLMYKLNCEY